MNWMDVSMPLRNGMPCWPGDPPPKLQTVSTVEADGCMVSRLELGSHSGTHIDAPRHFIAGAAAVDAIAAWRLMGPCQVLDCRAVEGHIGADALQAHRIEPRSRILLKTRNGDALRRGQFHPEFVALDLSAARWLAEREVALVGIDYLSIEPFQSAGHPVHLALLQSEVAILEGVDLFDVEPGEYELVAAPLRLQDGDGSPARVWLGRL